MTLKEARKKANRTVAEVAKEMGVSQTTVWRWEGGSRLPSISKFKRLATFLGVTPNELIGSIGTKEK